VAGVIVATTQEAHASDHSTFRAPSGLEDIVYVFFFVFAGAELIPGSLAIGGLVALVYAGGRTGGKVLAGMAGGALRRDPPREGLLLGLAPLPQAGVVVGLALDADARFPEIGSEVLSVVMAALVLFELVGPLALRSAMVRFKVNDGDGA
jgi:Kef-type K+ transport system membrane component KefB